MNPENSKKQRLSVQEMFSHTIHGSRIPNLIRPLLSDRDAPTQEFAEEFTTAFISVLLLEGDSAIEYIHSLSEADRTKLVHVLEQGGIGETEYLPYHKTEYAQIRSIIVNKKNNK
jgi:hypothetical protein